MTAINFSLSTSVLFHNFRYVHVKVDKLCPGYSIILLQVLTDRFAKDTDNNANCTDLNSYCGGTFNGIIQKLDYLQGNDRV